MCYGVVAVVLLLLPVLCGDESRLQRSRSTSLTVNCEVFMFDLYFRRPTHATSVRRRRAPGPGAQRIVSAGSDHRCRSGMARQSRP
jgi:hypothetical protein